MHAVLLNSAKFFLFLIGRVKKSLIRSDWQTVPNFFGDIFVIETILVIKLHKEYFGGILLYICFYLYEVARDINYTWTFQMKVVGKPI